MASTTKPKPVPNLNINDYARNVTRKGDPKLKFPFDKKKLQPTPTQLQS